MVSRRDVLLGASANLGVVALPQFGLADVTLGSASLTTVSDGSLSLPAAFIFDGMPQAELNKVLSEYGLAGQMIEPECNLALLRDGDKNILFDVGSGPDFMPNAGKISDSLAAVGLSIEDITHVLFTHAHPDHIWGLLDDFDDPVFPNAQFIMGRKEWDYWWNPETVNTIGDARMAFAVGAKRRMEAIENAITLVDPDQEVLQGINSIATYGHTPGHLAYEISKGGDTALVVGDSIGNHHVAFHHPKWASGSDQDPEQAVVTRTKLLDRLANEKMPVVGFHLPNGGIGRVEATNGAYRFISEDI